MHVDFSDVYNVIKVRLPMYMYMFIVARGYEVLLSDVLILGKCNVTFLLVIIQVDIVLTTCGPMVSTLLF